MAGNKQPIRPTEIPPAARVIKGLRPTAPATAIVLSGGGAKGDFEVGAVRYLYDHGIRPGLLCGTSVGSINALKLAEGEPTAAAPDGSGHLRGLAGLERIWLSLQHEPDMWLVDPHIKAAATLATQAKIDFEVFNAAWQGAVGAARTSIMHTPTELGPVEVGPDPLFGMLALGSFIEAGENLDDLKEKAGEIVAEIKEAYALANLDPIAAKMRAPGNFDRTALASSGIKLRLAMVALEDGQLRYATEKGVLIERDGRPTMTMIPDPAYAEPIEAQMLVIEKELHDGHWETVNGKEDPEHKALRAKLAELSGKLAKCPKIEVQQPVDPITGALASSSIPAIFPAVGIGTQHYVDGGCRMLAPIEGAVRAGAGKIYAIGAGTTEIEPVASQQWRIADTAERVGMSVLPNEVGLRDYFPLNGWGADTIVITPRHDVHDSFTIDPGLIRINMGYGYMTADDVVQAHTKDPANYRELANSLSEQRQTHAITKLRAQIWNDEFTVNGKRYVPVAPIPPTPSGVTNAGAPLPDAFDRLRLNKILLKQLVEQRLAAGGACPAGHEQWWLDWEAHNWQPFEPLWQQLLVIATPAALHLNTKVTFTVKAWAKAEPAPDAVVKIDGKVVGKVGQLISYTFTTKKSGINPKTHQAEDYVIQKVTVEQPGYPPAPVHVHFT